MQSSFGNSVMVDAKLVMIATAVALYAAPALAQDDPRGACDRCAAPQVQYYRQTYSARSETVSRVSYSEGYLTWPGKDGGEMAGPQGPGPQYGPDGYGPGGPPCPPVRPGERVISCRYLPFAQQADIAPSGGVLYAEGGVGPEYIPGGGGGGTTIIEGGSNASSNSSSSASASASASITINENNNQRPYKKGGGGYWGGGSMGGGGSWPSGSMSGGGGGSWPSGSMGGSGSGSWPSGSMSGGGGSWPSGSMGSSGSGGVGGHSGSHGGSHGHGKK